MKPRINSRNVRSVRYGTEIVSFVTPIFGSSIPGGYKECGCVKKFRAKTMFQYPENYPYQLFKNNIY